MRVAAGFFNALMGVHAALVQASRRVRAPDTKRSSRLQASKWRVMLHSAKAVPGPGKCLGLMLSLLFGRLTACPASAVCCIDSRLRPHEAGDARPKRRARFYPEHISCGAAGRRMGLPPPVSLLAAAASLRQFVGGRVHHNHLRSRPNMHKPACQPAPDGPVKGQKAEERQASCAAMSAQGCHMSEGAPDAPEGQW